MDQARRSFVAELYASSQAHDHARTDRLERFRNVEPATAELLGVLIRLSGARRILELGTSNGYSTIWLADAAEATEGMVVSVDTDSERTELARANLRAAGVEDRVELRTEDAGLTLRESSPSEWQFIFLDAERPAYPGYLADLVRVLAPRGALAVDNALSHQQELVQFPAMIEAVPSLAQTVVAVGAGLRLAVRTARGG